MASVFKRKYTKIVNGKREKKQSQNDYVWPLLSVSLDAYTYDEEHYL